MSEGKRYKWTREKMVPVEWGPYMNYLDHLAALRRAKAEGVKFAVQLCRERASGLDEEADLMLEQDDLSGPSDEYHYAARELRLEAQVLAARAAQIEEGEG